jgi:pyruvate/2-oxoacid:ferredoxin oxidoreductase alpha subunit
VGGGGHGNYKTIVLAPNSAQEMCDLTMLAFDLADKYRNPAVILADGYVGQMMEPVVFPHQRTTVPRRDWALYGDKESKRNLVSSIHMSTGSLETHNEHLQAKYARIEQEEVRFQEICVDDADLVLVAYGIVSRLLHSVTDQLRAEGKKVGLFRPITLFPFPSQRLQELAAKGKHFLVVELSNGQMINDVKLATRQITPIHFYNRMGGAVPSVEELINATRKYL